MVLFESGVIFIGGKIFSNIINDTSNKVVNILETAIIHNHTDVHELFTELDLDVRLDVINSLIKNIKKEHSNETVDICLKSLYNAITKINKNTHEIDDIIKQHKEKYFNEWRQINVESQICEIRKQSVLLDKRFSLLTNIVKFYNNVNE